MNFGQAKEKIFVICLEKILKFASDCSRGDPEIIDPPTSPPDGALFPSKGTPRSCTGTNSCGTNRFSCEKIGTASFCCPRPQEICSPNGGLDYTNHQPLGLPIPNQPFDEGTSGGSSRTYSRQIKLKKKFVN